MKRNLLLKTMLLLCALVVGSGSVIGADVIYKSQHFKKEDPGKTYSKGVTGYTGVSFDNTYNGFTCTYVNFNNNNLAWDVVKCGGKNGAYTGVITTKTTIDKAITKVEITIDAITANNVTSITLYSSDNGSARTSVGTFTKATGTQSVTITSPAANKYYKIEFVCTKGGSNGLVTLSQVDFYMTPENKCTVTYSDGGSETESTAGAGVTLPVRDNPAGSTFVGWSETNISTATKVAPTILTGTYNPTSDITLYPVYRYKTTKPAKGWYEVIATDIEDGTYAICSSSYFMKASINNNRFENGAAPSISSGKLNNAPADNCIWEVYKKAGYYRIKNDSKYAGGTTAKNQGALLDTEDDDHAKWTITYTGEQYVIENYGRTQDTSDPSNSILRNNEGNGWATYASSTGYAPRLFIKCDGSLTETFYISSIPATSATVTLASACTDGDFYYGTYSNNRAFVVPDDVIVSEIKVVDGKLRVSDYETGEVVPANTGVMISSYDAGEHTLTFSSDAGTSIYGSDNMLKASGDAGISADDMAAAAPGCTYYRLTMHNGTQIGYWWGAYSGAAFAVVANKAYLAVPPSAVGAKVSGFTFEDTTTGIANLNVDVNNNFDANAPMYNLAGQRVTKAYKGVVIQNGKKMLNK